MANSRKSSILSDVLAAEADARRAIASEHAVAQARAGGDWLTTGCGCPTCRLVRAESAGENADVADGHGGKRDGAGRPPSADPLQVAQVRFKAETLASLTTLAQSRGATVSELVREIVEQHLGHEPRT